MFLTLDRIKDFICFYLTTSIFSFEHYGYCAYFNSVVRWHGKCELPMPNNFIHELQLEVENLWRSDSRSILLSLAEVEGMICFL